MDGRFDRSGDHCPIQSRVSVSVDGGGRVVQVCAGGTCKSKTEKDVMAAFEKILKRSDGREPLKLQTDEGKEF